MVRSIVFLPVVALAATLSVAAHPTVSAETPPAIAAAVTEQMLIGQVGPYGVGVHLTIRGSNIVLAGHYYYAKKPIDIPLTGLVTGESVMLREPGGGVFNLHFETSDRTARRPLDFGTSTALVGSWSGSGRVFPVRLRFDFSGGAQGISRYQGITDEPAELFEARVRRFLRGATTGDRAEAASAVSYPLRVSGARPMIVRNRVQLLDNWTRIFTPCYTAVLRTAVPHEMFVRNGSAMVANGAAWFASKGASVLNVSGCPA